MNAFVTMLNKLTFSKKVLMEPYLDALLNSALDLNPPNHFRHDNDTNIDEQKRLILYYSKGRLEPVIFYKKMAELKKGTMTYASDISEKKRPSTVHTDTKQKELVAKAKDLNSFLSKRKIGDHTFKEEEFSQFIDSVRIDNRSQVTFFLKCGLALSEWI